MNMGSFHLRAIERCLFARVTTQLRIILIPSPREFDSQNPMLQRLAPWAWIYRPLEPMQFSLYEMCCRQGDTGCVTPGSTCSHSVSGPTAPVFEAPTHQNKAKLSTLMPSRALSVMTSPQRSSSQLFLLRPMVKEAASTASSQR